MESTMQVRGEQGAMMKAQSVTERHSYLVGDFMPKIMLAVKVLAIPSVHVIVWCNIRLY